MEVDPTPKNPDIPESFPPQMPYPTQQPPSAYAPVATVSAYPQQYYPNQFAPGPQPAVYQPVQYAVPVGTAPPVMGARLGPTYNDYLCWSIVNILFCCLPIGLVALVFSCKAQDANARQDAYSAGSHASVARRLNFMATSFGFFAYICLIVYLAVIRNTF